MSQDDWLPQAAEGSIDRLRALLQDEEVVPKLRLMLPKR
jgi:hypothetical protein